MHRLQDLLWMLQTRWPAWLRRPAVVLTIVLVLITAVGWLDHATGADVRAAALYLFPLLLAGWHLSARSAVACAVLAAAVWLAVLMLSDLRISHPALWVANGLIAALGFITVALLITKLRAGLEREHRLSQTDSLTGLANRRCFVDRAAQGLALAGRQGYPVSLAFMDLDNFKSANDLRGHAHGDALLVCCARLIAQSVRRSDTVGRMGGDEFAVFLPSADTQRAQDLVDRIRTSIDTAPEFVEAGVTISIGLASQAPGQLDLDALLRDADTRMYQAKRQREAAG